MINGISYIWKMTMTLPSQEELLTILSYDPMSGHLTWKDRGNGPGLSFRKGRRAGNVRKDGYIHVGIHRKQYYAHRLIWCMQTGEYPDLQIDHQNLDKADNSWRNLRLATPSQNKANIRALNKLKAKGINQEASGRYRAKICVNGQNYALGTFDRLEDAKAAYAEAAKKFFGEFARAA
jgi:hypothetical protein